MHSIHNLGKGWVAYLYNGMFVAVDSMMGTDYVTAEDIAVMQCMRVDTVEEIIARGDEAELRRLVNAPDNAEITTGEGWIGWTEMSGYLDRTDNIGVFSSEMECLGELMNLYGEDDDDDDE